MAQGIGKSGLAAALALAVSSAAFAGTTQDSSDVQSELQALKAQVAQLQQKEDEGWMSAQRTQQIKSIVQDVLTDAKARGQFLDSGLNAGYNNGFFIESADKNFKLVANGYLQFRYTYSNANVHNAAAFAASSSPVVKPTEGNSSGFDFRRARLIFSGNAFTPNLTYMISGDFAGGSSNNNDFQILDVWGAYKFTPWANVRAGSFLIPFSRNEYISSGQEFVDWTTGFDAFDPVRSNGVSLFGEIMPNKLSYEVNVNNGSKSNSNGRTTELGGKFDNRLAYYGRVQFAGSGTISDFGDDPDLQNHKNFVWMLGAAGGYESQNSSTTAFPSPSTSLQLAGLSANPGPGFISPQTVNGDLYRATVDFSSKWRGFNFDAAGYFQQVNENPGDRETLLSYYHKSSFFEASYFAQAGYFIVPKKWMIGARFSQLLTEGQSNTMEEYTAGVNYYVYGENFKIQADVSWIPNEAALTDNTTGAFINTEDVVGQVQVQLKF